MDDRKEKNAWLSVPQFGDWDQKHQMPDYSLDFSKIREMRKQNKKDISRASLGNEEELVSQNSHQHEPIHPHHAHHAHHSPTGRKRFFSYFNCCVKA
ncbi:hypothetical protein CKAN_02231100 [Cinnamomum micranthum f. kanehirae]|uniref:RIN4 pathogenic type III effector avirulence factor Avr cleavage site domain-containing protein n=1 Tax=Cinnamomum micranthum f. kanehirae TaxID=337451 RepID=A0A3S4PP71_9MAGN|nr:hypothetical protein CKAN_02231100 [Cinnamomum micranthum f. kanehirae]